MSLVLARRAQASATKHRCVAKTHACQGPLMHAFSYLAARVARGSRDLVFSRLAKRVHGIKRGRPRGVVATSED